MNDTEARYEDFLPAEHGKLTCKACGMVANVDPEFHRERYAHAPVVSAPGGLFVWVGGTFRRDMGAA